MEPGKLPLLHRLSRTEYENAIRDLLALDALPKEMDYSLLLPPDNASSGFDNIADLLFVSPTAMESYLEAARKISRLAIGDPSMPVMVNTYRLSGEHTQDIHVRDLPFGTRGGFGGAHRRAPGWRLRLQDRAGGASARARSTGNHGGWRARAAGECRRKGRSPARLPEVFAGPRSRSRFT